MGKNILSQKNIEPNSTSDNSAPQTFAGNKSINEVALEIITYDTSSKPEIGKVHHIILKNGPQTYKIAVLFEIINSNTGKFHHYKLDLIKIRKKKGLYVFQQENKHTIDNDDEISALFKVLSLINNDELPSDANTYKVITTSEYNSINDTDTSAIVTNVLEDAEAYWIIF